MSSQPTTPASGPIPVEVSDNPKKPIAKKTPKPKAKPRAITVKPSKILPNWRVGVAKQFDIVRAYAAASSKGTKPVSLEEASRIAGLSPNTVVAANPFLTSIGLLRRNESGTFLPCPEAVNYVNAYEWDAKTAAYKIGPKLRESWVGEALLPALSYEQTMEERAIVNLLAEASGASREYEKELRMLIEFMVIGGVVQRDGGQIKLVKMANSDGTAAQSTAQEIPGTSDEVRSAAPAANRISTSYAAHAPSGGVDFNITVHVDMTDFGGWHPDRIQAFFRGIAEVLAAKAGIETGGIR